MRYIFALALIVTTWNYTYLQASKQAYKSMVIKPSQANPCPPAVKLSTIISKDDAEQVWATSPQRIQDEKLLFENQHRYLECLPEFGLHIGPAGTGKFSTALAIARKTGLPCFAYSCAQISNEYADSGTTNIDRIFKEAWDNKPCIVIVKT